MERTPNPPLATARLRLDPQVRGHAEAMLRVLADPRIYAFIPTDPPTDLATLAARYERLESRRSPDERELWLNWIAFCGDDAIGTVEATVHLERSSTAIAYLFDPARWGHGYAREAVRGVLDHLEHAGQTAVFTAHIDTRNQASRRLVEQLGFLQVGTIEGADTFKGSVSDEAVYVLTAHRADCRHDT